MRPRDLAVPGQYRVVRVRVAPGVAWWGVERMSQDGRWVRQPRGFQWKADAEWAADHLRDYEIEHGEPFHETP